MFINHFKDLICLVIQFIIVHIRLVVSVQWEIFHSLNSRRDEAERKLKSKSCVRQNYVGDDIC